VATKPKLWRSRRRSGTRAASQMEADADVRAYDALLTHPRAPDLGAIARSLMTAAAHAKRVELKPEQVTELASQMKLPRAEAATPFGNALDVLQRGPEDDAQRALARALAAYVVAQHPPKDGDARRRLANEILWLATYTHLDATPLIDRALGGDAAGFWEAIAERIRSIDRGGPPGFAKGEALVGCAALALSRAPAAGKLAATLAAEVHDRKLARVLGVRTASGDDAEPIVGEFGDVPRGRVATALLAMTGVLLALHVARLFGKIALAYRRPAEVLMLGNGQAGGVRVRWRVEVLGRTLRDTNVVVPRADLARAMRDVRYPRLAFYAALLSLAVGSYVGVSAFVDGVRAASPSLLAIGIAIVVLGLALDFALSSIAPGARGRCRIVFVTRDGKRISVGGVDVQRADAALKSLAHS
jgi:hypothetical protein